ADLRATFLDRLWDVYGDLIDLAVEDGRDEDALRWSERARRYAMSPAAGGDIDVRALLSKVPAGTMVLYQSVSEDALHQWLLSPTLLERRSVPVTRAELASLVEQAR